MKQTPGKWLDEALQEMSLDMPAPIRKVFLGKLNLLLDEAREEGQKAERGVQEQNTAHRNLRIIVRGKPKSGKTTMAYMLKDILAYGGGKVFLHDGGDTDPRAPKTILADLEIGKWFNEIHIHTETERIND